MVISLALATVAVAVQVRAISALHASQADYVRAAAEVRLNGAQTLAEAALAAGQARHGRWPVTLDDTAMIAEAEPDSGKLALTTATTLEPPVLASLGASHPATVQAGLMQLAASGDGDPQALAALDPDPHWKACAPRFISIYGKGSSVSGGAAAPRLQARAGEVWRVQVRDGWGWIDTRTVRFTGDADSPARVIYRNFHRSRSGDPPCPLAATA